MTFDRDLYLRRIGLADDHRLGSCPPPSVGTLQRLQVAQMRAIPFENIDVFLGAVPDLDEAAIWKKLVGAQRGGYCLELNALFGLALTSFGFNARPILGRVRMGADTGGPRAHHAFVVTADGGEWLADTGFGGPGPVGPLSLATDLPQEVGGETFRIRRDVTTGEEVLERMNGKNWFSLYGFDRTPTVPVDFIGANLICARWEKSPFPTHLMMTVPTAQGRLSLFDRTVKESRAHGVETTELSSSVDLRSLLVAGFSLDLSPSLVEAIWRKLTTAASAKAA